MNINSPFKFLDAYEKKDKSFFFGRDEEIELLFNTAFSTNLLLVYGQTGTGKTSLLQCGLTNRFRESDWYPLNIKRGDNIITSLWHELYKHGETPPDVHSTICDALNHLYLDFLKPVYLIFDQFEELFILGQEEEQSSFFRICAQLLQSGIPLKIIFIMREEYIAMLYRFENVVPKLFNNRIRIEPMHRSNVEEVILNSGQYFNIPITTPDQTVKRIIDYNMNKKGEIHLPYLQVYLDRLYKKAFSPDTPVVFSLELVETVGNVSNVMDLFLEEQTQRIQQDIQRRYPGTPGRLVREVLNHFVTPAGTSRLISGENLLKKFPGREAAVLYCLDQLKNARVLQCSEEEDSYEIAHDSLAKQIDNKRSEKEKALVEIEKLVKDRLAAFKKTKTYLNKNEINYIDYYFETDNETLNALLEPKEKQFIQDSKRKQTRKQRLNIFSITAVAVIILLLFITAVKWSEANKEKEDNEKTAKALNLVSKAQIMVGRNPTKALGLAEEAIKTKQIPITHSTAYKIYVENYFYKTIHDGINKNGPENRTAPPILYSAISADGKIILTSGGDSTLHLWNGHNGQSLDSFEYDPENINAIALSADGDFIFTGHKKGKIIIRDKNGNTVDEFSGARDIPVDFIAYSALRQLIVLAAGDGRVYLKDMAGNLLDRYRYGNSYARSVSFSPGGTRCLAGYDDGTVILFNIGSNPTLSKLRHYMPPYSPHKKTIHSAAFSPDGDFFLTGSEDGAACLWDANGNIIKTYRSDGRAIQSLSFSADGNYLFFATKNIYVYLMQLPGSRLAVLKGHTGPVKALSYQPQNQRLLSISSAEEIFQWNLEGGIHKVVKEKSSVNVSTLSPDNRYLFTALKNGKGKINNVTLEENETGHIIAAVFTGNDRLITGSSDGVFCWWDSNGKLLQRSRCPQEQMNISAMAISRDGKQIIINDPDPKKAWLWQLQVFNGENKTMETPFIKSRQFTFTLPKDVDWLSAIAYCREKEFTGILTGWPDGSAGMWNENGDKLQDFNGHESRVNAVAIYKQGEGNTKTILILTGSEDKTARLWDEHGNTLQVFTGHGDAVTSVAFSADGKYIVIASKIGNVRIWHRKKSLYEFLKDI